MKVTNNDNPKKGVDFNKASDLVLKYLALVLLTALAMRGLMSLVEAAEEVKLVLSIGASLLLLKTAIKG